MKTVEQLFEEFCHTEEKGSRRMDIMDFELAIDDILQNNLRIVTEIKILCNEFINSDNENEVNMIGYLLDQISPTKEKE